MVWCGGGTFFVRKKNPVFVRGITFPAFVREITFPAFVREMSFPARHILFTATIGRSG